MADLNLPAPDDPAEEWGRLAVSLPGWRWMPGMLGRWGRVTDRIMDWSEAGQGNADIMPDPDDPATAGCLLALLSSLGVDITMPGRGSLAWRVIVCHGPVNYREGASLGRACIAAAAALGRWPGGAP